jgi:hypothetical protein
MSAGLFANNCTNVRHYVPQSVRPDCAAVCLWLFRCKQPPGNYLNLEFTTTHLGRHTPPHRRAMSALTARCHLE